MNKETATLIYWALQSHQFFYGYFDQEDPQYFEIKKARVKIHDRYRELKSTNTYSDAERIACVEWLMSLEI